MVHAHVREADQENRDDAAKPQVEHQRQGGDVAVPFDKIIWWNNFFTLFLGFLSVFFVKFKNCQ